MHADLKWLAENVSEWGGTYSFKHIFLKDGRADYSSVPDDVVLRTFTRDQWQAARDELEDPFSSPEEDEAWQAAEKRMDARNKIEMSKILLGGEGNLIFSPEDTDIWEDAPDDAEYYGTVSKRFYKLIAGIPCSALSWNDQRNFWQFTIMPTDEFEGPGFIKRPPDNQAMPADLEPLAQSGNDGIVCSTINGKTITGNTYNHWQHPTNDITAYDPPGPTSMPECTFTTPDEEEAWREVEKKINPVWQSPHDAGGVCVFHGCRYSAHEQCYMCVLAGEAAKEEAKQARYQDTAGEDWIDEAARTFTPEEFRGAMRFSIGKYNRRMGKKDELIKEIEKMKDYCQRWIDVEEGR
jgi:hypothetical protein